MNPYLDPMGSGRVYRDRRNGALVVDEDSIARGGFAGEEPELGHEGSPNPEYAGSQEGEFEGEGDEFGANRNQRYSNNNRGRADNRPYQNYPGNYSQRPPQSYRAPAQAPAPAPAPAHTQARARADKDADGAPDGWVSAILSGSESIDEAGQVTVTIRAQHPFVASDMTFEGSSTGAMITKIDFGDRPVVTANGGLSTSVFTPTSQMRKHLKGQDLRGGLDITVVGKLEGAGKLCVAFFGFKPPAGG